MDRDRLLPVGVERLNQIKAHILSDVDGFNMGCWLRVGEKRENGCGTTACIAGWLCYLNKAEAIKAYELEYKKDPEPDEPPTRLRDIYYGEAADFLLFGKVSAATHELFYSDEWPDELSEAYDEAYYTYPEDRQGMANAAVRAIDAFIAKYAPVDPEYRAEIEDAAI